MSNLLMEVKMNRIRGHNIFPQSLKIYEDMLVFKKRKWFIVDEMTVTFNHVAQSSLKAGIFFSTVEITTSGGYANLFIPHIFKKHAKSCQKLIEQKIYRLHAKKSKKDFQAKEDTELARIEKSLSRLRELQRKGSITQREFEKKRKNLIKSIG